ncbi:unnamed protein product [Clonostachys rhizophaga]|uniref:N-acetyltransferase domain-containing protein n=1 Tax=Clonostachys rhizophaga TaxID=160324 RepID=A0A9N9V2S3_9HYPO|nr:unnamed protein product [Clonostachys rhizophaga]
MGLKVVPATEADAKRAVEIEDAAYGTSPMSRALFPGPFPPSTDGSHPRASKLVDILRADPANRWVKVVDTGLPEGESMIAFASWFFWTAPHVHEPETWPPGTNPEACERFFGGMIAKRNERFAGKPYSYLKLLHTDPNHQRRGAGSMLIDWGLEESSRLGIDSYLESSIAGQSLYAKCGFEVVDTLVVDLSPWGGPADVTSPLMLRPVSKS